MISNKFIIDVAPIARLPLSGNQFFSYLHEKELAPGTLVTIPLFRRAIEGIVVGSRPDFQHVGGFELKPVYSILQENYLTDQQLKLAQQLSQYYLSSFGVVLKHFMPKRVKARANSQLTTNNLQQIPAITLTLEQQIAVDTIANTKYKIQNTRYLLYGPASSGKTEVYIHSILQIKKQSASWRTDAQFLILLPELTLTPQAIERYGAYFPESEIVLLHSKLPKGQFYQNWQRIQSGEAKIIIASRAGLFAPFKNLGLIVVDEEQDMSYKQWDMNPRYDARQGAMMLAENFKCPVIFGTATPRVETFYKTLSSELQLLQIPKLPAEIMGRSQANAEVEIVDMRKEKWTDWAGKKKPNYSMLSLKLQSEISWCLQNKLQVMLFINHQGMSSFSVCSACGDVLKCPKCDRALVYDENGTYKCLHCSYATDIIPSCKKCGALTFKNVGLGTQAVVKEVKKLFRARVARLDTAAIKKPGAQQEIYEQFMDGGIEVLVGTQMITKGWDNPRVGLVAIIDTDSLFSFPDYLTDERAFANIMQIAGRTGRVGAKYTGKVIIQTFNPQNPIFEFVKNGDYESFYIKDIKQREALSYPPIGKLIKLTCQEAEIEKLEKESLKVFEKLKQSLGDSTISIIGPNPPLVSKVRGKHRKQILIKIKDGKSLLPSLLLKVIFSLGSNWIVDVDPVSIA